MTPVGMKVLKLHTHVHSLPRPAPLAGPLKATTPPQPSPASSPPAPIWAFATGIHNLPETVPMYLLLPSPQASCTVSLPQVHALWASPDGEWHRCPQQGRAATSGLSQGAFQNASPQEAPKQQRDQPVWFWSTQLPRGITKNKPQAPQAAVSSPVR